MNQQQKITACAFLHKDGKLFIAKRADTKQFLPGKYELPGGHIEFGEAMEQGLQREFEEEFEVKVTVGEPFHVFTYNREKDGVALHVVEVVYFVELADEQQEIKLHPEDHSEYQWISASEVNTYLNPDDEETKAVRKGFKLLTERG
jgi:8-oxo-dGTP diphosphatase